MEWSKYRIFGKVYEKMAEIKLSPGQCRAARALLGWTQKDLEVRCGVNQKTVADFERGSRTPFPRTLRDIVVAFEAAGVRFIEPEEGVTGRGLAFVWGIEEPTAKALDSEEELRTRRVKQVLPHDPDLRGLYDYWRERPDEWQELSDASRRGVLREIFGELPDGDPIIEWSETNPNDATAPM